MKELVALAGEPEPRAYSLILIGLTLRTFSAIMSICICPFVGFVHAALATISPLKAVAPEVTLKVALTLAPGAIDSEKVLVASVASATEELHPAGTKMLNLTPTTGVSVVLTNVTVASCEVPGANVWSPGGVAVAEAGAMLRRGTLYLAATMFA